MTGAVRDAIVLAAGIGKRLRPFTNDHPKSLLEIGGKTLMERHLERLAAGGVRTVRIVVGHCADQIRDRFGDAYGDVLIRYVDNPDYKRGSILSLLHGLRDLGPQPRRVVWMDADVLYHPRVLEGLLEDDSPLTFLLDSDTPEGDEEMILGVTGRRVMRIDRGRRGDWDLTGESVGFFSIDAAHVARFTAHLAAFAAAGHEDAEYEEALNAFLPEIEAAYVDVAGLPWTEIDFPEDVGTAEQVLARLRELGLE